MIEPKLKTNVKYSKHLDEIVDILTEMPQLISHKFHNECVKKFGNKDGREIYQLLKKDIKFSK